MILANSWISPDGSPRDSRTVQPFIDLAGRLGEGRGIGPRSCRILSARFGRSFKAFISSALKGPACG